MSVGLATLLFQSLTRSPILTPSLLGFDALYLLIQTGLVFVLGKTAFSQIPDVARFVLVCVVMLGASFALFGALRRLGGHDLTRMILIGVIFAVFFRSLDQFLERLLDPTLFAVVQNRRFANFNDVNLTLMGLGSVVLLGALLWVSRVHRTLDVLLLGPERAQSLGIDVARVTRSILVVMALLVSVSTALVGPISFLGLLVCALTYRLMPSFRHAWRVPMVVLIAIVTLVLGQTLFERVLSMHASLSVVIEFVGGLLFCLLLIRARGTVSVA